MPMIHDLESLQTLLGRLPREAFVVALYINDAGVSQDEWMRPLASRLRAHSTGMGGERIVTLGILTPRSAAHSRLDTVEHRAIIEPDALRTLKRIQVFIVSDLDWGTAYPASSKVLGCMHALDYLAGVTSLPYLNMKPAALDGWLCPFPLDAAQRQAIQSFWNGFADRRHSPRSGHDFLIIPAGYPRLATLAQSLAQATAPPDAIAYAPIGIEYAPETGGQCVKTQGIRILRTLLAAFPDTSVIFRPYRADLKNPDVCAICDAFSHEPRFILDDQPDRLFVFSRSAALVTDASHIAKSFCFSTLRPALYLQPWLTGTPRSWRWSGGHVVTTYAEMVRCLRDYLANAARWRDTLSEERSRLLMPFDTALDDIAALVRDFYAGASRPEWLRIERGDGEGVQTETTCVRNMLSQESRDALPDIAACAVMCNNPHSPLLAAVALHSGREMLPETPLLYGERLAPIISALLDKPFIRQPYRDIAPDDIRRLYSLALLEMFRNGDADGLRLTEGLLAAFNALCPQPAPDGEAAPPGATTPPDATVASGRDGARSPGQSSTPNGKTPQ